MNGRACECMHDSYCVCTHTWFMVLNVSWYAMHATMHDTSDLCLCSDVSKHIHNSPCISRTWAKTRTKHRAWPCAWNRQQALIPASVHVIDLQVILYARLRTRFRIVCAQLRHTQQQHGKVAHTEIIFLAVKWEGGHTQTRRPFILGLWSPDITRWGFSLSPHSIWWH